MNKSNHNLAEPGIKLYLLVLIIFAAVTLSVGIYWLAGAEAAVILVLLLYSTVMARRRAKQLQKYIEEITYDTENARNNTLTNFPLPISAFRLDDSKIVWGNEKFFELCGSVANRANVNICDIVPDFSAKWLLDGHTTYPGIITVGDKKYTVQGNIVHSGDTETGSAFMGITYWIDVTDYEAVKLEYASSRPVAGIIIFDNFEEMIKNESERDKNDIRDAVEDRLTQWGERFHAIVKRYERDRYIVLLEQRGLDELSAEKFTIIEQMHQVANKSGIQASVSIGLGAGAANFSEALQAATVAAELAVSRGGDQAVIKNGASFEFFGGRGYEVEKRTKVRSRVIANTLCELICDSSKVFVMGHAYSDFDALGACVGVCALAAKCGVNAEIVIDRSPNACETLLAELAADEKYRSLLITPEDAMLKIDGRSLVIVCDTGRPEKVFSPNLLETAKRIAVIDHHRVGNTYIENAAMSYIEPYSSSACELLTEILEEGFREGDLSPLEANALLSGIMLDTKNFTVRTGERTFDAASWLRHCGADTMGVKRLMRSGIEETTQKLRVMEGMKLYGEVAIASSDETKSRVIAAKTADEMLNISGVEASVVILADGKGGCMLSARSMGKINVQIIMEKLGGGGNATVAATQLDNTTLEEAEVKLHTALDDYFGSK